MSFVRMIELRADNARENAAEQHPGNRFGLERVARGIGGGEAIALMRGGIEAGTERAGAENQKRTLSARPAQQTVPSTTPEIVPI